MFLMRCLKVKKIGNTRLLYPRDYSNRASIQMKPNIVMSGHLRLQLIFAELQCMWKWHFWVMYFDVMFYHLHSITFTR